MLSATERKYRAAKAEMLAAVQSIEKFRSHLEGREFILRVDNTALKWLKTYSMTSDFVARWITALGAFKMRIEHRLRDKHFNADRLSKKTEFYENREEYDRNRPDVSPGFAFLNQDYYDQLPTVPWLDKDGREITPELQELACSNDQPTCEPTQTGPNKVCSLSERPEAAVSSQRTARVRILKRGDPIDPTEFPITKLEVGTQGISRLTENEQLALAKITKADSPSVSPVVREDEPLTIEPPFTKIVALSAESLNAGAQEGALEMIRAIKLVNAAT